MPGPLFPTSLVGSYPQPDWLIDRAVLAGRFPPRVRARELWRVDPAYLEQAQRDAARLAVDDQRAAGLDILTDGETGRESYSNALATALDGVDVDNPGTALDRSGHPNPVPRIVGPIRRRYPVGLADLAFLRAQAGDAATVKVTVPGPFTMAQQAQNDYYPSVEAAAYGYGAAVHDEIVDLFAAGADIVQVDEPYLQARPEAARQFGVGALNAALDGVTGTTAVHLCFGYAAIIQERPSGYSVLPELADAGKTIILGVLNLGDPAVESPDQVAERVRRALPYIPAGQLVLAPDCGMKYLPRESAFGKLRSMTAAAARLRADQH